MWKSSLSLEIFVIGWVMTVRPVRLVASDVDGTITVRRGSLLLSTSAVEAIRLLESQGIKVSLVSGNSLPVVAGLARYVGATGPSIGENGCIMFYNGDIIHLCDGRPSDRLVQAILDLGFRESWQNKFRFHDLAFLASSWEEAARLLPRVRELVSGEDMRVLWSGYAVHVQPREGGKGRGVSEAARLLGVSLSEVLVIGDGENDLDMFLPEVLKACPGDAEDAVRRVADIVASKPGGEGFAEIVSLLVSNER